MEMTTLRNGPTTVTNMLDLNKIREEFAAHLAADPTRFRMDSALAHVVTMAYRQGVSDAAAPLPLAPGVGSNAAIQT